MLPIRKTFLACASTVFIALLFGALPSSAAASDKDCPDFATQRAAQFFFLKHGGPQSDPDRLDADHDGVACEDNPCPCYFKKHLPKRPAIYLIADRRFLLPM
ncbi:MAG TPA: excalibur calcium-binding domain-containing protein [Solirubrobacterales bacterium]|nr:excalibur calcium-binding domain-containing protein [Solirubrobacterales bacterium]